MLGKPYVKLFSMVLAVVLICGAFTETLAYSGRMLPEAGYTAVKNTDLSGTFADSPSVLERYRSMLGTAKAERTEAEQETVEETAGADEVSQSELTGQEDGGHAVPQAPPVVQIVGSSSHTADSAGGINSTGQSAVDENALIVQDEPVVGNQDLSGAGEEVTDEPVEQEAAAGDLDISESRETDRGKLNDQDGSYAYGAASPDPGLNEDSSEQEGINPGAGDENPEDSGEKKENDGDEEGADSRETSDENTEDIEDGEENSAGSSDERDSGADDGDNSNEFIEETDQLDDLEPVQDVQTDEIMLSGNGTAASPFLVENEEQLLYITSLQGGSLQGIPAMEAHYRLMADLDLSEAEGFYGVGSQAYPFRGVFDGNGYTVTLNINASSTSYVGLFRYVSGARITNVSVAGSVTGSSYAGGIAGHASDSVLHQTESSAAVRAVSYAGGTAGYASGTEILESRSEGSVTTTASTTSYSYTGGIAGYLLSGSRIADSASTAAVAGQERTGGAAGYAVDSEISGTLVSGGVTGRSYAGGITGQASNTALKDVEYRGVLSGTSYAGGIAGGLSGGSVEGGVVKGSVSGAGTTGGIVGATSGSPAVRDSVFAGEKVSGTAPGMVAGSAVSGLVVEDSGYRISGRIAPAAAQILLNEAFWDEEYIERGEDGSFGVYVPVSKASGGAISGNVPESIAFQKEGYGTEKVYLSEDNAKKSFTLQIGDVVLEESSVAEGIRGDGTEESPFLIESEEQLLHIVSLGSGSLRGVPVMKAYYRLEADLDLSGAAGFFGMGSQSVPFQGTFDGSGRSVELNITSTVESYVGLFRYADGAEIRNIHVSGSVRGVGYAGGIAGGVSSTGISGSSSSASVTASGSYAGGIAGHASDSVLHQTESSAAVRAVSYAGGTAGYASGTEILESRSEGSVTTTASTTSYSYTGGIAGHLLSGSRIADSASTAAVAGQERTGGAAGYAVDSEISGTLVSGGVTGRSYAGGITGQASNTALKDVEYRGVLSGTSYAGGIAGGLSGGSVEGGVVKGSVSGAGTTGGIVGATSGSPAVRDSVFAGEKVSGTAPGMVAGSAVSGLVVEDSGYRISGRIAPADAQILLNEAFWDEEYIERGEDGSFGVYVPVSKASGGAISGNVPESIAFQKEGYGTEKVYLSEDNAKKSFTLQIGDVVLEESSVAEGIRGDGTEESPFLIESEEQLLHIVSLGSGSLRGVPVMKAYYRLEADLDLSGAAGFFGMGSQSVPFQGTFDGSGRSVELNITSTVESYVGLFRYADGAEIRNIHVSGSVRGVGYAGGIAGGVSSTGISGSSSSASVTASGSYAGGIAGHASDSVLHQTESSAAVRAVSYAGGTAGYASGTEILESRSEGSVTTTASTTSYSYTGGIAGYLLSGSRIADSASTAAVAGQERTGGAAGYAVDSEISGTLVSGGVTGRSYAGGITGQASNTALKDVEYRGVLSGTSYAGGIAGGLSGGSVEGGVVKGSVSGAGTTGGIVGATSGSPAVRDSVFAGEKVSGTAPGMVAGSAVSGLVVEDSGYRISGRIAPADAQILLNEAFWDEEYIERGEDGSFGVYVPVSKASGGAISGNVPESIAFQKEGYGTEKVYLSEDNAKKSFTLQIGDVVLEESSVAEGIRGDGTEESPFLIESEEQLLHIVSLGSGSLRGVPVMKAYYRLEADLDLSGAAGFFGMGSQSVPFQGTFDGSGRSVELNITSTVESYVGLFRYADGAEIRNIHVSGSVRGVGYAGGIAGGVSSTGISGSSSSASVTASGSYAGGIAGHASDSVLHQTESSAAVRAVSYAGGTAGYASGTEILESRSEGSVTTTASTTSYSYTGGIAGHLLSGSRIADSASTAAVAGQERTGGAAGYAVDSEISGTLVSGGVTGRSYAGGITGQASNTALKDVEYRGVLSGTSYAGGIAGGLSGGSVEGGVVKGSVSGAGTTGGIVGATSGSPAVRDSVFAGEKVSGTAPGMVAGSAVSGLVVEDSGYRISGRIAPADAQILLNEAFWDEEYIERGEDGSFGVYVPVSKASGGAISGNVPESIAFQKEGYGTEKVYLSEDNAKKSFTLQIGDVVLEESSVAEGIRGDGTEESPFLIESEEQLLHIVSLGSGSLRGVPVMKAYYRLEADLDLSGAAGFFGMGSQSVPFQGTFDGSGRSVELNITSTVESYVGLFRYADGAEIRNIHVSGSVRGVGYAGGIAGGVSSTGISGSSSSASVTASGSYAGGIAGHASDSVLHQTESSAAVRAVSYAGGTAGYASGTEILESRSEGSVTTTASTTSYSYTGGIAGHLLSGSRIADSASTAAVAGQERTGGAAGYAVDSEISGTLVSGGVTGRSYAGGITGQASNTLLKDVEYRGVLSGTSYAGGIAGGLSGGSVEGGVVKGSVSGAGTTGGIVGATSGSPAVRDSVFAGEKVSGTAPGMVAGSAVSGLVVEDSGYRISGQIAPADAQILLNEAFWDEEYIERGEDGSFGVYVPVSKASGGAISGNVPESIAFQKEGYGTEKVYLSEDNAKKSFTLQIGDVVLEESSVAEGIRGDGTEESPFLIESEEQFMYIASLLDESLKGIPAMEAHYRLGADLDLRRERTFFGLGSSRYPFSGSLDGSSHTVRLNISTSVESYVGLFRYTDGAEIHNISISGSISGVGYTGGIAGYANNSTISGVEISAGVTGTGSYTGGAAGYAVDSSISGASVGGRVSGSQYTGGLVGYGSNVAVDNAVSSEYVYGGQYTGGIAGRMVGGEITGGRVSGSVSTSSTATNKYSGGMAGHAAGTLFHGNIITDTSLSNGVNVLIGDGSNNQFYENGILLSGETSVDEPEISFTGFEDITPAETIKTAYEGRTFTSFIPVNQSKNNSVTAATMRLSKAAHYDRLFTLKSSGAAYNFVLPAYIALVPKSNVLLDVVSVESPENAVIDTVLKTVSASVANDISSAAVSLETSEGTTWKLYSDAACTMEIADLVLNLEQGQNTAYIEIVGSDGESRQIYTLNIFREHQKPMPVTGLLAITGTYEVQLRWDMAYEASVQGYNLYRSVSPGSGYTKITTITSRDTLSYVDRTVTADWTYYYKISAYNDLGIESDLSDYVSVTVSSDTVSPVVLGISPIDDAVVGKNTDITVRVEDNTALKEVWLEYQITGEAGESGWQLVDKKTVTGTSAAVVFQLGEISHHGPVWVRAFAKDQKDNVSDGTPVRLYYMDSQGPEKVTGLTGTAGDNTVTLRWNDVADDDFSYFIVEQKSEAEEDFHQIAKVTSTLGHHAVNLQPDTGYWFRVRAFDRFDNPGEYSDAVLVYTNSDLIKPQVTAILPKPGYYSDSIPVQITATDNVGVAYIEVELSTDRNLWTSAGSKTFETPLKSAAASFDISTAGIPEGPVFVRAFAEDAAGNRSSASSIVEHRVDRTPPARPQGLLVENTAEYILVQWEKGSEADLKAYSVYRAESLNGDYVKVKGNLSSLGYCDTDAAFGKTYYYKVTAIDAAGNESAFSDAVSGTLSADDTAPWIYSVSPGDGSPVGINATIRVQARDNVSLASITAEYADASGWAAIGTKNVSGISAGADFIWDNQSLAGGEYQVRFYAEDAAGNTSDYITAVYELKNFTIDKPDVELAPEDMSIRLSWEPVSYADVQGYRVYRVEEARDVLLAEIDRGQLTSYTDHNLDPDLLYAYYVEVYDQYGNVSVSDTVTGQPLNNDPYPPEAKAGFDMNTMVGVETVFNGDMSTDNVGIVSYQWDFGDGSTGEGVRAIHVFQEAGAYTVTLTVKDAAGNQDSDSIQVRALSPSQAGTLTIKVVDQDTGEALADASVYVDYPEEPLLLRTDSSGEVTIVAEPGTYGVSAYKIGYLPKEYDGKVEQYIENRMTVSIPKGDIVVGEMWTERLTLEEIEELGIDTSDPDNQHVYNFEVTLVFQEMELDYTFTVDKKGNFHGGSGSGSTGSGSGGGRINLPGGGSGYVSAVPSPRPEVPPSLVFLTVSNSTSFLKEFYSVNLTMQNMADPQFVLTDNEFTLNIPDGLSLAETLEGQDLMIRKGDIPGGSDTKVSWIVRGDTAGAYELSVYYRGILMPFQELVEALFTTQDDMIVGGGEGLKIYVSPERQGFAGEEYRIRYAVKNEGDYPHYNVKSVFGTDLELDEYTLTVIDDDGNLQEKQVSGTQYQLNSVEEQSGLPELSSGDSIMVRTLAPGEVLYGTYVTKFPVDTAPENYYYKLVDSFYSTLEGSTVEIPVVFVDQLPLPGAGTWRPGIWNGLSSSGVNASGYYELDETVLSVAGINSIQYALRHYSGYEPLEEDVFNTHPDDSVWDFGTAGWSSNYEMKAVPQDDGSINLYLAPGMPLRFTSSNAVNRMVYGRISGDSVEVQTGSSAGEYFCAEIGYQNYTLVKNTDGTFELTDPDENVYCFNSNGELTHTKNRVGQTLVIQNSYARSGEMTKTISEVGSDKQLTTVYNGAGNISNVTDNMGREVGISYVNTNGASGIGILTDALGNETSYEYDGHRIIRESINNSDVFSLNYDEKGRVLSQTDAFGKSTRYSYDDESVFWRTIMTVTDRDGRKEVTSSNRLGQAISVQNGLGHTTFYTYSLNGDMTSIRDGNGNTTIYNYDDRGNLLSIEDPEGVTLSMTYDSRGNVLTQTSVTGAVTTYTYSDENWCVSSVDERGVITEYKHNEHGQVIEKYAAGLGTASYTYESGRQVKAVDFLGAASESIYDDAGRMISKIDKEGNVTSYTYDNKDRVVTVTDPLGNEAHYTYDERGNLLVAVDPRGNATNYVYDGNNRLIRETDALGQITVHEYDGEGNTICVTAPDGSSIQYIYDNAGQNTAVIDEDGNQTSYAYDPAGRLIKAELPNTGCQYYEYDRSGRITKEIDPMSGVTEYQYDTAGQLALETDPVGSTKRYTYDQSGNPTAVRNGEGYEFSFAYDPYGRQISETDANGNTTSYEYDAEGRLTKTVDALGNISIYEYDGNGRIIKYVDAKGAETRTVYDGNGNVTAVTNALGHTFTSEYDEAGNVTVIKDAYGTAVQTISYDALNRPETSTDALNNTTKAEYDALNRVVAEITALNEATRYSYDLRGNLIAHVQPEGGTASFTYDEISSMIGFTDANGGTSSYSYDLMGQLIGEQKANGSASTYQYNAAGFLVRQVNGRGQELNFGYDRANRLIEGAGITYTHDGNGNILTVTNEEGTTARTYDPLNRVTSFTDVYGNVIHYSYDEVGNRIQLEYPDGKIVKYSYDLLDQMETVTDYAGRTTLYIYDKNGRLIKTGYANGLVEETTYDDAGQVISSTLKKDNAVVSSRQYRYDGNGNIITETSDAMRIVADYDKNGQLVEETNTWSTGRRDTYMFSYDPGGNMTGEDVISRGAGAQGGETSMSYATGNQLENWNGQEVLFDPDGNMTWGPISGIFNAFEYDSRNQLVKAGDTSYGYDGEGRRIWQRDDSGSEHRYITDPNAALSQLLVQQNSNGSSTYYVYGQGLISQEHTEDGVGEYRTFHYDYRGSTIFMSDEEGAVTDRITYDPYGAVTSREGSTETSFLYVGKWGVQSDDNGLIYMRARYYNTDMKRFVNEDPIKDGLNWYVYAGNNPLYYVDPSGLDPVPGWAQRINSFTGTEEDYAEARSMEADAKDGAWSGFAKTPVMAAINQAKNVNTAFKYNWTGTHVTSAFKGKVIKISGKLGIEPDDLMAVMAFESRFNPAQGNLAGGSAMGLIQFTSSSAQKLGTTSEALSKMSAVEQLDYVYDFLSPYKGRMNNLGDVYMAVLWPGAIGKSNDHTLWTKGGDYATQYNANSGLDVNNDGKVTRGEALQKVIDRRNEYGKKK